MSLEDYEPVEDRLRRFWADHPEGRVVTELVHRDDKQFIVRAEVYRHADDPAPAASGYAQEVIGSSPVNRTSALENSETSAAGRAMANLGYSPKGARPSREEMAKATSAESAVESEPTPERMRSLIAAEAKNQEMSLEEVAGRYQNVMGHRIQDGDVDALSRYLAELRGDGADA